MDVANLPRAAAGRRRFWIVVAAFAAANLLGWIAYHHWFGPHRQRILRVDRFTPGERAVVGARPMLAWHFNLDAQCDLSQGSPASIIPAIAGNWEWRDARTLAFFPSQDLPRATRFTMALAPERLRTPEGFRLAEPFVATILTTPLRVVRVQQAGFEAHDRYLLSLEFNDRVLPADLGSKLKLTGPDGKDVRFKPHGQSVDKTLFVLTDSVGGIGAETADAPAALTVRIEAGLAGTSGPLGLEEDFVQSVPVGSALAAIEAQATGYGRAKPEIQLSFNGPVEPAALRQVISIEPAVEFTVNGSYRGVLLAGDFKPGNRYTIKIAEPPGGTDRKKYPRAGVLSVFVPDRRPGAWFEHDSGYLGSMGNRTLLAHAVNVSEVRVQVWRVYENNLVEWRNSSGRYRWQRDVRGYARPIASRTIPVRSDRNTVQDVRLSLDDLLPPDQAKDGAFRVSIAATSPGSPAARVGHGDAEDEEDAWSSGPEGDSCIVTLSDLALTAKQHAGGLTVWVTSLSAATPVGRARVRVYSNKNQLLGEGHSNRDGLVNITKLTTAEGETPAVILADGPASLENGPSRATQPASAKPSGRPALTWMDLRAGAWDLADIDVAGRSWKRAGHEAFIYTERGGYRPGEVVHLRAIVRRCDGGEVTLMPVRLLIRRPDLREWRQFPAQVDAEGSVGLDLAIPADATTGRWVAELGIAGESTALSRFGQASFLVEEFVPNRLKTEVAVAGRGLIKTGSGQRAAVGSEPLRAIVQADYLFGRPGAGLTTTLSARLDPCSFSPAGWKQWTIGDAAGVIDSMASVSPGAVGEKPSSIYPELSGRTLDDKGHGEWQLDLQKCLSSQAGAKTPATQPAMRFRGPWELSLSATVQETGGRTVSAGHSIAVDVLPWYIAIRRAQDGSVVPGEPVQFEVALVQPAGRGAPANARLVVRLFRETWNSSLLYRDGRYHYESHRVLEDCGAGGVNGNDTANRKAAAPRELQVDAGKGAAEVIPPASGAYIVCVQDPASGAVTSLRFYASGTGAWEDNVNRDRPERLEIVVLPEGGESGAGQPAFRVGQRARAIVKSPFAGRLLLTIETDRLLETHVIEMEKPAAEVPFEITESLRPNGFVTASVIRAVDPNARWGVHRAFGTARVSVDPSDRQLAMEISAPSEVRPLSVMDVSVRVIGEGGRPAANVPLTLAAVDEGVLQLTWFKTPDPLGFFHRKRALEVNSSDLYGQLMPEVARPDRTSEVGGDGESGAGHLYRSPVSSKRIKPVALFAALRTDENGVARTNLAIPEFAGQLRVMAVAHLGKRFGSAERNALVRSPLLVQSTFPRFAAPGDRFTVPVTIFNNGAAPANVSLTADLLDDTTVSCLGFAKSPDRRMNIKPISIPAGGQHLAAIEFVAREKIGVAQIRLVASAGDESSQESTELPIRPASPMVSRGGYGMVKPGEALKVSLEDEFLPGTQSARVTLSPMPAVQVPQGLEYLERYPHGCAEQTVSTSFPLIYLAEIGPKIAPGVFEKERVKDKIQAGILRLLGMQTADGGLAMWPGNGDSWPWASVYGAHFIVEARAAGHAVPASFEKRLLAYVRSLLTRSGDSGELLECQAYACYVLALAGKPDRAFMSRLAELGRSKLNGADESAMRAQSRLYLSLAWLASGRRDIAAELLPAALPPLRAGRQGGGNVGSPIRDRAMLLNTMLAVQPDHPMIPALVQQLARQKWLSTQDTAFAVMALGKYIRQAREQAPFDRGELLLEGSPVAAGREAITWNATEWLGQQNREGTAAQSGQDAPATRPAREILARIEGAAASRGYVSWICSGVPRRMPASEDHGIKIRRRYLDERGRAIANGRVQSGSLVLVELTIESPSPQRNIVVEDLLPAGLEIENGRLETTAVPRGRRAAPPRQQNEEPQLMNPRLDIRDDRMLLFGDLPAGMVRHVYAARAVVEGSYIIPPARVECMYDLGTMSLWGPGGTLRIDSPPNGTIVETPVDE